jgi:hypothetical protein
MSAPQPMPQKKRGSRWARVSCHAFAKSVVEPAIGVTTPPRRRIRGIASGVLQLWLETTPE